MEKKETIKVTGFNPNSLNSTGDLFKEKGEAKSEK